MAKRITRKDIVEEKVFQIGPDYAKSIDSAIEANAKWLKSFGEIKAAALEYNQIEQKFALNPDRAKFLELKEQEEKLRLNTAKAVKAEQDALTAKQRTEQAEINTQKKKLQLAKQRETAARRSTKLTAQERLERQRLNKLEREEAILKSKTSTFLEKLNVQRQRAARIVQDLVARQQLGNRLSKQEQRQLKASTAEFNKYNKAIRMAKETTQQFQENVGNYPKQFSIATSSLRKFIGAFGLTSGIFLFAGAVRNAIDVFNTFDQAQADLAAILGKTRSEVTKLTAQAKELGATTAFTASQVSALQLELSKLGFSEDQILASTLAIENFAIATGVEASRAAKLAGAAIRGFGLEAEEANRVASVLAVSTTKSASSFESLETALPKVSAIAKAFGFTIEDTTALLSQLQNAGFEASIAGTSLRKIFIDLASENGKLAKRLGGSAKTLDELVGQLVKLRESGINLSEAFELTSARSVAAFNVFLEGAEDIGTLRDSITDVEDGLDALAEEKLNSIRGELTLLNSAWEGWILSLDESDKAATTIRQTIQFLTNNLSEILNTTLKLIKAWLIYKGILLSISLITRLYSASVVALRIAKIALAGGIGKATVAMKGFNLAVKSNPIGLLLSILAAGVATWFAFADGVKESSEALVKLKENMDEVRDAIIANDLALIDSRLNEIDRLVDDQRRANEEKIKLLNEEIQARKDGTKNLYTDLQGITKEAEDARALEQKKRQEAATDSYNKYIEGLKSAAATDSVPVNLRVVTELPDGVNVPDQFTSNSVTSEADKEVTKELIKRRKELIQALDKLNRDAAKREQKKRENETFELQKFLLEQQIKFLNELAENEKMDFEVRFAALEERAEAELALAEFVAKSKFKASARFNQDEINQIIEQGVLTNEQRKKATDAELLIFAQLQAKKREILRNNEADEDDLTVERIRSNADRERAIQEKALAEQLALENKFFQETINLYESQEDALRAHEERKAEIKRKYAIEGLNAQIAAIEELLRVEDLSAADRAQYEQQLAQLKLQISDITTQAFTKAAQNTAAVEEQAARDRIQSLERVLDVSFQLAAALTDLANAILDARIQAIDEEIQAEDEKFNKYLENENLTAEQREEIQRKQEESRKRLEKKRREEQRKQAIFNKALAIVDVGINTALAIIKSVAASPLTGGQPWASIAAAIGAIQAAAIVAAPIPKYFRGTENHPGGLAEVGERRPEVIQEPGKDPYIVRKRGILNLPKGTRVIPRLEEYDRMMRASATGIIQVSGKKLLEFQASHRYADSTPLIKAVKENTEAVKRNKPPRQKAPEKGPDLNHEIFRFQNINWHN